MNQTVLITGGTGFIGRRLTTLLQEAGYQVAILSRSKQSLPNVTVYEWNVQKGHIDPQAIATADHIVHLAGEGVADERWTDKRKDEILNSRVQPTELLTQALSRNKHNVKSFVGASAIGFYGTDTGDRPLTETTDGATDFLAQVVRAWERAEEGIVSLGIRTVKIRIGVVLMADGGALAKIVQPIRLGAGAPIGSGQQYVSWIHQDDLCQMISQGLTDTSWRGVYNGVAPNPVTNETLTRTIAQVIHRPILLPNIPAFAIKLLYGEMGSVVTGGNYVLNKRITEETSFQYQYPELTGALENLLS